MSIRPFAMEQWMHAYEADPPRYYFAGSTGPVWTVAELLALEGLTVDDLADDRIVYGPVDGSIELRQAVADYAGAEIDDVLVTTGAAEALAILVAVGATPGGNVVAPSPGYPAFDALPGIFGQEVRTYALRRQEGFRLDPERVIPLIDDDTGLVILNSPHNPTGALVGLDEARAVRDAASHHGVPVLLDQVFHPIGHGSRSPASGDVGGTLLVGDTSKAMSLAGLRIGWIVDPDPERRAKSFDLRAYFTLSSTPLTERLAAIALRNHERVLQRAQTISTTNLDLLEGVIDRHPDRLDWVRPQGGLIAFPWFTDRESSRRFCLDLAEAGVLVTPGDTLGEPPHFRIGFGSVDPVAFAEAMKILDARLSAG